MSQPSRLVARALRITALLAVISTLLYPRNAPAQAGISRAVAISPDAHTVAWTLSANSGMRVGTGLHLTQIGGPDPMGKLVVLAGPADCTYDEPTWSPDGETLAFLSTCVSEEGQQHPDQEQIFLWSKQTGQARQLTHLAGELQQLAWSPNSKAIGFLFVENATRSAGALDAMKPWSGVIGEDGIEIQQIYAVDAGTGKGRAISPPNLHVFEFSWSPAPRDGGSFAYIAAPPPGENNWWVAKLYTQGLGIGLPCLDPAAGHCLKDGGPPSPSRIVLDPATVTGPLHGLQIAVPRFSADGSKIAFIGGLMSDQGATGGDLYVTDANPHVKSPEPVDITPGIDGTVSYEGWDGNDTIGFVENRRGHTLFNDYDVKIKAPLSGARIDLGEVSVGGGTLENAISVANTGSFAMVKQGFAAPPEVWTGSAAHLIQLTHLNDTLKSTTRTESIEWTNGPFHIQGWLTFPLNYDPHTRYPLVVQVHGGPSSSVSSLWNRAGHWPERGYFEFQPNPRGSFGQGEAFTAANRKDFGYGDLQDILAGLDVLEAKYPIDKNREGLTGWSYGGFMTMFAVTQTHRFRSAIAGAGVSDWLSYYGENSIDQWMTPFFGASVYDDPAVYAKSSAITFIKQASTPTLVIVGDRDGECPAPQSFEFWHALRELGVKTQLVVYPNEGHRFRDPEHIRDRDEREAKWFADTMPASPQSTGTASGGAP